MSVSEDNPDAAAASNLWALITGYMPARVVHVAVQLGVADLLAGEAKTADASRRDQYRRGAASPPAARAREPGPGRTTRIRPVCLD